MARGTGNARMGGKRMGGAPVLQRERVAQMIRGLGQEEAESILVERGDIEVGCDFCGKQYRFDAVDAAQIFTAPSDQLPASPVMQ